MYLDSKSLPWVYPQVLLSCPPGAQVAIVSPWIEDIPLQFPNPLRRRGLRPSLSTLLDYLQRERGIQFSLYYRKDEQGDLQKLLDRIGRPARVREVPRETTHAKGVATPELILSGSPNLLWRSFYLNEENVTITPNNFGSVREAVTYAFNIR